MDLVIYFFSSLSLLFRYSATKAALDTDIALYVGLSVAVAVVIVFAVLGVVMLRILRRKHGGHSPMFPVGASGKNLFLFISSFRFLCPSCYARLISFEYLQEISLSPCLIDLMDD